MKKYIALALVLVMVLSLVACGGGEQKDDPKNALVGTWKSEDGKEMDFTADGNGHALTANGLSTECTWTYLADSNEFELAAMAFGKGKVTISESNTITWNGIEFTKAS